MSRFFRKKDTLKASIPRKCYTCGVEVQKAGMYNAVWVNGEHVGYVCGSTGCSRHMKRKE